MSDNACVCAQVLTDLAKIPPIPKLLWTISNQELYKQSRL